MAAFKTCGYQLAEKSQRLPWSNGVYEGYDRENFQTPRYLGDPIYSDGSELWQLQHDYMDRHVYLTSADETLAFQAGLRRNGLDLDALRVRVVLDDMKNAQWLRFLPTANEVNQSRCEFLGYDVGWLMGRHSILFQPGFMDRYSQEIRCQWASLLNGHGLFSTVKDATRFREEFYRQPDRESGDMEILEISRILS
jgi:hypothetical protein